MTTDDINPNSNSHDSLVAVFETVRSNGQFVPPSTEGTIIFPGFDGGGEWGGAGYDPNAGVLYVNANEMPWILTMVEQPQEAPKNLIALGQSVYQGNCMGCHGAELQGSNFHGNAPSLVNLDERLEEGQVHEMVRNGKGAMPSFAYLTDTQTDAVTAFLLNKEPTSDMAVETVSKKEAGQLRYNHTGYNRFVDSDVLSRGETTLGHPECH